MPALPDSVAQDWRRHWEFGESGAVILRGGMLPHDIMTIVANQGQVTVQLRKTILNDRENARYFATRIMEAVAIAEAQEFAFILPKEGYELAE